MSVVQMSIQAGVMILAIVVIRAVALDKLPKNTFLALWGIALLRLLVPCPLPSPFSVYSLVGMAFGRTADFAPLPGILTFAYGPGAAGTPAREDGWTPFSIGPLALVWMAGGLAMLIFFAAVHWRNCRELRFAWLLRGNETVDRWLGSHHTLRPLSVLVSDRLATPVTAGCFRPRIILPKTMELGDEQLLRYVLAHEYGHIRRLDAVWKGLVAFALCLHWFNPLVWVMAILVNRDLELTCDEMVIRRFGAGTKAAYAYSLIGMAEQRSTFTPLFCGFGKTAAEERIVSIMKYKKKPLKTILVSLVLLVVFGAVFATTAVAAGQGGASAGPATAGEVQSYQQAEKDWERFGVTFDERTERVYYQGQPVRFFVDNRSADPHEFSGTVFDCRDGTRYLVTRRDEAGKLVGIDEITAEQADEIARWR